MCFCKIIKKLKKNNKKINSCFFCSKNKMCNACEYSLKFIKQEKIIFKVF